MSTRSGAGSGAVRARLDTFEAFRLRLVDGYAERLVDGMTSARAGSTSSLRRSRIIGAIVVLPVHLVTVASLLGGLYLLLSPGRTWPERVAGLFLLLVCYGTRPELPKRPAYVVRLQPGKAPTTFALLQQVGDQVGAPVPDEFLIGRDFNASVARVGLRKQAFVLGAPLWVAAAPQARVALLAHELGHIAHKDLTSGLWVGTARHTLRKWNDVFRTPSSATTGTRRGSWGGGIAVLLSTLLFPIFRGFTGAYTSLVEWANAPAHRRQELLADLDAARVAGTDGALEMFDTLLAKMSVETSISSAAVDGRRPDLWAVVTERLAARGPEERTRARAHAAGERTRIDAVHPATTLRIRLVEGRPWEPAALTPDAGQWTAIDSELAGPLSTTAKAIGERIRYRR